MLSLKIINGTIVDGSGGERYRADVGIMGDHLVSIGDLRDVEAEKVIDAAGKIVAPGFIDIHTHSDLSLLVDPLASAKLHDGVTTEVIGNCGIGVAPVNEKFKDDLITYLGSRLVGSIPIQIELPWTDMDSYLATLERSPAAVNVSPLLAQGVIRINEMGFSKEHPTPQAMERMKAQITESMQAGCVGLSSGLVYMPGEYTTTEELGELCTAIAPFGGFYVTHIRNMADEIFPAIEEAIQIARLGGVPLHISHLKLSGKKMAGKTEELFSIIDRAKASGMDVTFDAYPYDCNCTSLSACVSPWAFEGGLPKMLERIKERPVRERIRQEIEQGIPGWNNFAHNAFGGFSGIFIATARTEAGQAFVGKTLAQLAEEYHKDPYDMMFDILIQEEGRVQIITNVMAEQDVETIVSHPDCMIGSDGMSLSTQGVLSSGRPHPRAFGTHGRVLSYYTRERKAITLENAIKKMTSMPAARLGMKRRGILQPGNYADVVVFDFDTVQDRSRYEDPKQYTTGFEAVIVNGEIALRGDEQTNALAGRVLRKR